MLSKEKILGVFNKLKTSFSKQVIFSLAAALLTIFLVYKIANHIRYGGLMPVEICSFSPSGEVARTTNFTFEFTSDIVDENKVNVAFFPDEIPITFSPAIPGRFKWLSPRTLKFFPNVQLQIATAYTVEVSPKICTKEKRFLRGNRKFEFSTERLKVTHTQSRFIFEQRAKLEKRIEWTVEFNQSVEPNKLKNHLKLYYELKGGAKNIPFKLFPEDKPDRVIKIISEIIKGSKNEQCIKLRIDKGLVGTEGTLGLLFDYITELKIETELKIYQVYSQQSEQRCWIQIEFSSPVSPQLAMNYIKVKPAVNFRIEQEGRYLNLKGDFKGGSNYQVIISKDIVGEDGTFLPREFSTTVTIKDLDPSLSFKHKGIFLCREGKMNLAIESVNLKKFKIEVNKIFANNLVYLLNNYESDYYWDRPYNLGKKVYEEEIEINAQKNQITATILNIGQFIKAKRQGLFRVTVANESDEAWYNDSQWVMATDLGIVGKISQDDLFIWVNSLKTLTPLEGVEINLISDNNQVLTSGNTDSNGVVIIKDLKNKIEDFKPFIITASLGEDISYLKFDECRMPISGFDISGRPHLTKGYEAYLYTDRGVFRPMEDAHIACLVRGKDVSLPSEFPIKLQVLDPTNRLFKEFSYKLTTNGICEFKVNLPDYAKTGKYLAKLLVADEEIGRTEFYVEEFIPDKIKVKVTTDKKSYLTGENALIDVLGVCLFGPPAADRKVEAECRINAVPFTPKKWGDYTFGDSDRGFKEMNIKLGEGQLDAEGKYRFTLNIPKDIFPPASLKGVISTTVTEEGGRAVSAYTDIDIHPYPFYIGMRPMTTDYAEIGKKYNVDYITVNSVGDKVKPNELSASFYRVIWHSLLKKNSQGYYEYVSEKNEQLIKSFTFKPQETKCISFVPRDYGEYKIVIQDTESKSASSIKFYASGWGYAPWSMANPDRIEIDLDKKVYLAGEVAKAQVKAPFPGKLLLTIEREKVYNYRVFNLKENTAVIDIPIEDIYKPNVYITATIIRSIDSKDVHTPWRAFGISPLMVDCSSKKLSIKITAPSVIRPNHKLNLALEVKGQSEDTWLTLAAVDEGICQLTDFQTPDPFNFFYAKKKLEVDSYDIYSFILPEVENMKKTAPGDYLEKVRKKHLTPISVKRVKPVSLWSGIIKVNGEGKATVSFDIPQFQGSLRIMAVGASGSLFGSARTDVIVRDPIVITSTFPRFLAAKDMFTVPVSIFNGCGRPGKFTVRLQIAGPVKVLNESVKMVEIPARKEKAVSFNLMAKDELGKVTFKLSAAGLGEKTEEITELPLRPSSPVVTKSDSLVVTSKAPAVVQLPGGWVTNTENAKLIISSLPMVKFTGGLQYLLRYPHGCIEQTTSRVFPLLYFDELAKIAEPELFKQNSAGYFVEEGIAKLESMQLPSGAFAYWPGESYINEWGSIYAAHFLVEAKKAGYNVNNSVYKNMLTYLEQKVKRQVNNPYDLEQAIYACYVLSLAGKPPKQTIAYHKETSLKTLSPYSRFQLAGCYGLAGDINTARFLLPTMIHPQTVERDTGGNFNSSIRTNAIMLDILAQLSPQNPGIPVLIKEITQNVTAGRWYTTQENAFAFLALGKVFKEQSKANFQGVITVSGKPYKEFTHQGMTIENKNLAGKKIKISLQGSGNCYLYWQVYGVPQGINIEESDKGISVRRIFLDKNGNNIDYQKMEQGELIVAKITMKALDKGLENVIICDMLPAGLEIENPRLESRAKIPWIEEQNYKPDYMDIRDDRLLLYLSLPQNTERIFYYGLRVVNCGKFILPPIVAECMYDPTYISTASSGMIKVVEAKK